MGRAVIAPAFQRGVTEGRHGRSDSIVKCGDRDLNIDHVFGGQAWHRGRADVIDAQG
jgi:hypothetical protein